MPVGFGVEPVKNAQGVVTSGTTDADIRKIYGGLFSPGLVSGAAVTTSASAMTYTVAAGVGAFKIANNETVLAPIPPVTVNAAAISGTNHIVYAQQNIQSADGNNEVVVKVGTTMPSVRAVRLAQFTLPAGATNSSQGVRNANLDWAIPYGASLGVLAYGEHTTTGTFTGETTIITKNFYVPTDRQIEYYVGTVVSAQNAVGFDNSKYCEAGWRLYLDNSLIADFGSPGLHQAWMWLTFTQTWPATPGNHTIRLTRRRITGPGTPMQQYGYGNAIGCRLKVTDNGVIV